MAITIVLIGWLIVYAGTTLLNTPTPIERFVWGTFALIALIYSLFIFHLI